MATIPSYDYNAHQQRRESLYPSYTTPSPYDPGPSGLTRTRTSSKKTRPQPDYNAILSSSGPGAQAGTIDGLHLTSLSTNLSRTTSVPSATSSNKRGLDLDAPPDASLSHPAWLRSALGDQRRIWESYNLLMRREDERAAARAQSVQYGAQEAEDERGPYSTWTA